MAQSLVVWDGWLSDGKGRLNDDKTATPALKTICYELLLRLACQF